MVSGFTGPHLKLHRHKNNKLHKLLNNKWVEIAEGWSKMHNRELHNLYSSPDIIKMIKSLRMRHAGKPGRKRPLEPSSVHEITIILNRIVGR
jgi:hypothetical protein